MAVVCVRAGGRASLPARIFAGQGVSRGRCTRAAVQTCGSGHSPPSLLDGDATRSPVHVCLSAGDPDVAWLSPPPLPSSCLPVPPHVGAGGTRAARFN
eukprot:350847-Chlamydomonas_euryale.AAC.6